MKYLIGVILLIASITLKSQTVPLPADGAKKDMFAIANAMYLMGEMSQAERNAPFSLSTLKSKSHLVTKSGPYSLNDFSLYSVSAYTMYLLGVTPTVMYGGMVAVGSKMRADNTLTGALIASGSYTMTLLGLSKTVTIVDGVITNII